MDLDPDNLNLSIAQRIALLPQEQREQILADMEPDDLLHDWSFWRRPSQTAPPGDWSTWLYMAGRGCVSGDTEIDLADGSTVRADDACRAGEPLRLLSLHDDGTIKPTWGTPPYIKGTAEIWTVTLDNGRTVAVTDQHRFLTPQGWQPLAALGAGSVIASVAPLEWRGDDPRSTRTDADSTDRYSQGHRRYDPQLPSGQGIDRGHLPSRDDVHGRNQQRSRTDGRSSSPASSHRGPGSARRARSNSDQDALWQAASVSQQGPSLRGSVPLESPVDRTSPAPTSQMLASHGFDPTGCRISCATLPAVASTTPTSALSRVASPQPLSAAFPRSAVTLRTERRGLPAVPPLRTPRPGVPRVGWTYGSSAVGSHPSPDWLRDLDVISWTRIVSVLRRGVELFYDLTVPGTENYIASSIINHNSGKTRTAAEWIHERVREGKAKRILLLGRTSADVRDVMVNGESGIMNTGHPDERPEYFPSKRLLVWPDGKAEATIFSADEPDQLRGPQGDTAWADEFASFPGVGGADGATAFDNLRLALRLPVPGDMPRMILTTTPRRTKAMFDILEQSEEPGFGIVVTKGTTYENLANLADTFRATILGLYEGTRLGQQELMGDMLADIEGALFMPEWFNANRVAVLPAGRMYTVVGVDPSVAERPTDECGIVVVKATMERDFFRRHVYVVEDASVKGSPSVWANRVAAMARKWDAPIVAEGNQGGELVRMAIAQADGNIPVHIVHAKVGKATRAEPVAALAESGRLHIVGSLPELENQAISWVPAESRYSPDRLDACVHAVLSVTTRQKGVSFAMGRHLRARSSRGRLPTMNSGLFVRGSGGGARRR